MRPIMLAASLSLIVSAAEDIPLDSRALERARVHADMNDYRNALLTYFKILRHGTNEDVRNDAREQLQEAGFTRQELLQLDPSADKPEELEKLVARVSAAAMTRRVREHEVDSAWEMMTLSVSARTTAQGGVAIDVQEKDLARALNMLIEAAISGDGKPAEEAQERIEKLGIAGKLIESARTAAATGKLPPEVSAELVPALCLYRLKKYREEVNERAGDLEDEEITKRKVMKDIGMALAKHLDSQFPQASVLKRESELMDFWRHYGQVQSIDAKF